MEATSAVTTNQKPNEKCEPELCAGDRLKAEAKEYFAKWAMGQCPSSTHGTRHHQRWIGFWAGVEWIHNRRVLEHQPSEQSQEVPIKCPICQIVSPVSGWAKGYSRLLQQPNEVESDSTTREDRQQRALQEQSEIIARLHRKLAEQQPANLSGAVDTTSTGDPEAQLSLVETPPSEVESLPARPAGFGDRDTQRLDWLEGYAKQPRRFTRLFISNAEDMGYTKDAITFSIENEVEARGDSLREAIDKAMNAVNDFCQQE
jgi:hypothetical protein